MGWETLLVMQQTKRKKLSEDSRCTNRELLSCSCEINWFHDGHRDDWGQKRHPDTDRTCSQNGGAPFWHVAESVYQNGPRFFLSIRHYIIASVRRVCRCFNIDLVITVAPSLRTHVKLCWRTKELKINLAQFLNGSLQLLLNIVYRWCSVSFNPFCSG